MNLTAKLGPLPRWAWLLLAAAVGYWLYRRHTSQAGSSALATQSFITTSPSGQSSSGAPAAASMGLNPSAGSPSDTGQTTSDLVSALGGQQASLLQALEATQQNLIELASMQIQAAQGSPQVSPSSTTETQPYVSSQPGGANAPVVFYLSPQTVASTPSQISPAVTTTPKPAATNVTPLRYYTYKASVPLGPNQTVHFATGRGYYAA